MAKMSYCRFENTNRDFGDCLGALNNLENLKQLSESERRYATGLYEMAVKYVHTFENFEDE